MTIPYNVGLNSMLEQLVSAEFFKKKFESLLDHNCVYYIVSPDILKNEFKNETVILDGSEMGNFATLLYFSVYKIFPNLENYVKFLNNLLENYILYII